MAYLKISRELLNSSLWRDFADKEKVILIELMNEAPYKPSTYNLYGTEIELNTYELCFSVAKMAERFGVSDSFFRRFIDKLLRHGILAKYKRKVEQTFRRTVRRSVVSEQKLQFYTSITFYAWAFGNEENINENDTNTASNGEPSGEHFGEHNIDIKIKEEKEKNSACAEASFKSSNDLPYKKCWYSMKQIAELDFAYANEIFSDWKKFSGRSENEVREMLNLFARKKTHLGLSKMTLDVFDKEFRKEMKRAFGLKAGIKNEPIQKLKELGTDE